MREKDELSIEDHNKRSLRRIFTEAVVVNVLNPKVALFFLAFLPQFVDPSRGSVTAQILVLGTTFVAIGLVTDGCYALLTGSFSSMLNGSLRFAHLQRWVSGLVYLALGVGSALAGSSRTK